MLVIQGEEDLGSSKAFCRSSKRKVKRSSDGFFDERVRLCPSPERPEKVHKEVVKFFNDQ